MFKENRLRWALAPFLLALAVVIACGGGDDEPDAPGAAATARPADAAATARPSDAAATARPGDAAATAAPASAAATAQPADPAAPAVDPKRGGELIRGTSRVHRFWDYNTDPVWFAPQTMQRIYSNLVRFDPADGVTIIPDAASDWSISDDAKTFTFTIRNDIKFHDGNKLTPDDVVATFERAQNPPEGVTYVRLAAMRTVESISASGNDVTFVLASPDVDFLQNFAGAWGIIIPRIMLESEGGLDGPDKIIGSGPYVMGKQELDSFIETPKNPDFYVMAPDGLAFPYLDKITTISLPDPEARIAAQQTGRVDITSYDPAEFVVANGAFNSIGADKVEIQVSPLAGLNYITLNAKKPPFDDIEARRAIYKIFDRARQQQLSSLPNGQPATLVNGFLGTIDPFLDEIMTIRENDPATRAEVLAEGQAHAAGVGLEGFTLSLQSTPPFFQEIAQLVAQVYEDGGLDVELRVLDRAANTEANQSGDWFAQVSTPNVVLPSVSAMLITLYGINGSNANFIADRPDSYEPIYAKIAATQDGPERDGYIREAQRILREDWVPAVPFEKQVGSAEIIANYVHGRDAAVGQWFNLHWYHDLWIDERSSRK